MMERVGAAKQIVLVISVLVLSLASCSGVDFDVTLQPELGDEREIEVTTLTDGDVTIEETTTTPTAVFIPQTDDLVEAEQIPPTAAPDPFRFDFPEAKPEPVSVWRPPLYPVPWAPTPNDHFYFSRPIAADEVNWPLANYRYGGVFFENVVHTGVDYPASKGTPVIAAGDGKVIWAGWGLYSGIPSDKDDPYGQAVVLRHDFGFQGLRLFTVYGHLSQVNATVGQHVELGDPIGLVGDTGHVTGPHLHFEVRVGDSDFFKTLNPELWVVPPRGWGVGVARVMDTVGQLYSEESLRIESRDSGRIWKGIPYSEGAVNSDPYYLENLVIGDLPAGLYDLTISYAGRFYTISIEIYPGRVTYFSFRGRHGFSLDLPAGYLDGSTFPGFETNPLDN